MKDTVAFTGKDNNDPYEEESVKPCLILISIIKIGNIEYIGRFF